jgi:hypothetical protein
MTGFELFPIAVNCRRLASRSEHRQHVVDGAISRRLNDVIHSTRVIQPSKHDTRERLSQN